MKADAAMRKSSFKITVVLAASLISFLYTLIVFFNNKAGYDIICLLPASYFLSAFIFIRPSINEGRFLYTNWFYLAIFGSVHVVSPFINGLVGSDYIGFRYFYISPESIHYSIILMAWGNFASAAFLRMISKIRSSKRYVDVLDARLAGSKIIYFIFIIAVFSLYVLGGGGLVGFFSTSETGGQELTSTDLLLRQCIAISMGLIFVLAINHVIKKKTLLRENRGKQMNSGKGLITALFFAALLVGMVVGGRRSVQLFTACLAMIFIYQMFPAHKRLTTVIISSVAILGIVQITISRWFEGGQNGSVSLNVGFWARYFQVYFGGPDSIATSMKYFSQASHDFFDFIYDFLRSMFGLSFMLRDEGMLTSEKYNLYLYSGEQRTGQLIFAVSYGNYYLGAFFSPVILMLNVWIMYALEKFFRATNYLELKYLYGYCFLRVAFNVLVNTPTIINVVTLYLVTMGLVIGAGWFGKKGLKLQ